MASGKHCVRKASLDRLYRAALLRNHFTDTILKAREKALEKVQGDKRDPKKVRMEREELERHQREDWWRATDRGRLKLKLQPRRRTAAMDGNDDGTDGGELRTTTNVSLLSEPFPFCFQFCVK
ncbi:putative bromodomain-containing protein [Cucumis melo var. makuwa]|uniref:Bromodomain-containing protein n=1 Tax=Cucumis melo var. makuwa TaxID=1194695 RepID=A0A5A7TKL0_CUCMM|nr:putative bromodomain-containing protein [Cucumis melo var. makuwa]TYK17851.1 putative bromodomain-containing protein [Cucumis melo var. makuwa]